MRKHRVQFKPKNMLLFETKVIKKFFDKIHKMDRYKSDLYNGSCQKEIFLKRACVSLKGLCAWIYEEDALGEYRKPILISSVQYYLGWGDELLVCFHDASRPKRFCSKKMHFNDIKNLEGVFCNPQEIEEIRKLFILPNDTIQVVFKAFKIPKRGKPIETEHIISASTIKEAFKLKNKYKGELILSSDYSIKP